MPENGSSRPERGWSYVEGKFESQMIIPDDIQMISLKKVESQMIHGW